MPDHARTAEALGAWALGACEPDESRAVEDHLRNCPTCALEADQLTRTADLLGRGDVPEPASDLRQRIVLAARRRRAPAGPDLAELIVPYARQVADLDTLLDELTDAQWVAAVPQHDTVRGVLSHLAGNDRQLVADLALAGTAGGTGTPRRDWRDQTDQLISGISATVATGGTGLLDRDVQLAGPGAPRRPLRDALVQRTFETWIHTDDIRRAVDRPANPPPPAHLRLIAGLAAQLLPLALRALGRDHPGRTCRLELTGAGGGTWDVPLAPGTPTGTPDLTLTASAVGFCELCANRQPAETFTHTVRGDATLAADVLAAAATLGCE